GKDTLDAHEVSLPPGGENPEIFDLPEPDQPTILRAALDVKDDLVVDNQAVMLLTPRRLVKALLVTEGNFHLEAAIKVDPDVDLSKMKPGGFTKPDGFDVVIFDGAAPPKLAEGNYLFVNCS